MSVAQRPHYSSSYDEDQSPAAFAMTRPYLMLLIVEQYLMLSISIPAREPSARHGPHAKVVSNKAHACRALISAMYLTYTPGPEILNSNHPDISRSSGFGYLAQLVNTGFGVLEFFPTNGHHIVASLACCHDYS